MNRFLTSKSVGALLVMLSCISCSETSSSDRDAVISLVREVKESSYNEITKPLFEKRFNDQQIPTFDELLCDATIIVSNNVAAVTLCLERHDENEIMKSCDQFLVEKIERKWQIVFHGSGGPVAGRRHHRVQLTNVEEVLRDLPVQNGCTNDSWYNFKNTVLSKEDALSCLLACALLFELTNHARLLVESGADIEVAIHWLRENASDEEAGDALMLLRQISVIDNGRFRTRARVAIATP